MEPIFAGKLSLTDDIPDQPAASGGRFQVALPSDQQTPKAGLQQVFTKGSLFSQLPSLKFQTPAERSQGTWNYIKDTYGQPQPLPEPGLSPAAQRVRAEAARLGIDYDAEIAKIVGDLGGILPNPVNRTPGPDPLANLSGEARRQVELAAAERLKRKHGLQVTWEE